MGTRRLKELYGTVPVGSPGTYVKNGAKKKKSSAAGLRIIGKKTLGIQRGETNLNP